ncbi:agamous-like MADS-box protein AGL80 [Hordeum vulgare subsp. vulgare]|uniref:MADS-box domain-containing protein n=1 Tax=Hordeum vulgare subsp. vulgare TaxID=112509 RepID=A0A8I6XWG9_HORVV|nr:agamous-like MADS-box protein AGL80 [Hordeum vulgare subsp. vulgare]
MARKKVTLQYIPNDSTRRGTFKKRRRGLIKKASELAILCDVRACVLVYGEGETVPEVFPSHVGAVKILNIFKSMPELEQCKKMMNQEGFLRQRIDKLRDQVHKFGRESWDREIKTLLHKAVRGNLPGLVGLNIEELTSVGWKVEMLLKGIGDRIAKLHVHPPAPYVTDIMEMGSPTIYQAPATQEGWVDMARSEGDLGALVCSGYSGGHDAASTSSSVGCSGGDMMQPIDPGFGWRWGVDLGASSTPFPPM